MGALRLDDVEGVGVPGLGAGVLLGLVVDLAVYEDQGAAGDWRGHPGGVRELLVLSLELQELLSADLGKNVSQTLTG